MSKISKELIKEFTDKYCNCCKAYAICGAELAGCPDWDKFIEDKSK